MIKDGAQHAKPRTKEAYKIPTRQRVSKGTTILDEKFPKWWERVEVHTLNIDSGWTCVLGQVYGSWYVGCVLLSGQEDTDEFDAGEFSDQHGFSVPCQCSADPSYHAAFDREEMDRQALEYAWKDIILSRLHGTEVAK